MKPTRWLAFAAALAGCALAYGIHLHGRQETPRPQAARKNPASGERRPGMFKPEGNPAASQRVRPASRPETDSMARPLAKATAPAPRQIFGSPDRREPLMAEAQWREHAARVEMEANHELNRLATLLDLDPVQQDKVFAAVARQSPYWLPGMQAGGPVRSTDGTSHASEKNLQSTTANRQTAAVDRMPVAKVPTANPVDHPTSAVSVVTPGSSSVTDPQTASSEAAPDVTAYLDADQQQTLIEEEMDRQAWWAEVLPQLLPPNFGEAAAAAAVEAAAPETKTFDGGEVLLEE